MTDHGLRSSESFEAAAKRLAKEYVAARQNEDFHLDLATKARDGNTLVDMKKWTDVDRRGHAEYLGYPFPSGLRAGLRLMTLFRRGCRPPAIQ